MKKHLIRWMVALAVLLPCLLISVSAASGSVIASGYCGGEGDGTNLTWTLYSDGELVIEGSGAMSNYSYNGGNPATPWRSQRSSIKSVTVDTGVTSIGNYAFYGCGSLTSVTIGDSVTSIGEDAFRNCSALTSVYYTGDVAGWCGISFYNYYATPLYYADKLYIGGELVTDLVIPEGVTSIGAYAFYDRSALTSVTIGNGVTSIGDRAFFGCSALTSVTIGDSVTSIGEDAFFCCFDLTAVYYTGDVAGWCGISFYDYYATPLYHADKLYIGGELVTDLVIPEGVTSIGDYAFRNYSALTSVTIGDSVTGIGNYAFEHCSALTSVTIPDSVTSIGGSAFSNCTNLTSVTIPDSVTSIENYAFSDCGSLITVIIGDGVTSVGNYAFSDCSALAFLTIGDSVTNIGERAFEYCGSLTGELVIPNNVTSIRSGAFYGCYRLTSVTIGDSVISIGSGAFCGCGGLNAVIIPGSVASIGDHAFSNCHKLARVYYVGNEAMWKSISFGHYNSDLTNVARTCVSAADMVPITVGQNENGILSVNSLMPKGEQVTVTATPAAGYKFSKLYVNGAEQEGLTFVVPDAQNVNVTAEFEAIIYSISARQSANGAITPDKTNATVGQTVIVTVTPNIGYRFSKLYVNGVAQTDLTFTMPADNVTLAVQFEAIVYVVAVGESANGAITPDKTDATVGQTITVTVAPDAGYRCSELYVNGVSQAGFTFTMPAEGVMLTAQFVAVRPGEIAVAGGSCGSNLYWALYADGQLNIYGAGAMTNYHAYYTNKQPPWYSQRGSIEVVILTDGVTNVGDYAFYECDALTSVAIPDGVTTIGDAAFRACEALASVTIGDSVTSIGDDAFYNCYLAWAEFMGDAPTMGKEVFSRYSGYAFDPGEFAIYYHSGKAGWTSPKWNGYYAYCVEEAAEVTNLDADNRNSQNILFTLNESAKTAVVGNNSSTSNNSGYAGSHYGKVIIPATVVKGGVSYRVIGIGQNAFSGNRLLRSVELGKNITSVDPSAFVNCNYFAAFTVATGNTYYSTQDGVLYDKGKFYLYVYPGGKTNTAFTVPASVEDIGPKAFSGSDLTQVTVPKTVKSIGAGAFYRCTGLQSLTLPFIGGSREDAEEFYYVFGSAGSLPQSLTHVTITDEILKSDSFSSCAYVKSITLTGRDAEIPYGCFRDCTNLEQLKFGGSGVPKAGQLVLPDAITKVGAAAFAYCDSLTSVTVGDSVTSIGSDAFAYCDSLTSVSIGTGVTSIANDTFYRCPGITEFSVAAGNKSYCSDASGVLYSKDKTRLINYPSARKWPYYNVAETATTINSDCAFYSCANLVNLYVPKSVTNMSGSAIYGCPGLTVCAYRGSTAYGYATTQNISVWPMDNYKLQGLEIYSLPEQTVFKKGQVDLAGLYVAANGGKALQADGYTVSYNKNGVGVQTVTVSYQGQKATFEILVYDESGIVVDFGSLTVPDGTTAFAAAYDKDGKMLYSQEAVITGGHVQMNIPGEHYGVMKQAKLFILNGTSFAPVVEATIKDKDQL